MGVVVTVLVVLVVVVLRLGGIFDGCVASRWLSTTISNRLTRGGRGLSPTFKSKTPAPAGHRNALLLSSSLYFGVLLA